MWRRQATSPSLGVGCWPRITRITRIPKCERSTLAFLECGSALPLLEGLRIVGGVCGDPASAHTGMVGGYMDHSTNDHFSHPKSIPKAAEHCRTPRRCRAGRSQAGVRLSDCPVCLSAFTKKDLQWGPSLEWPLAFGEWRPRWPPYNEQATLPALALRPTTSSTAVPAMCLRETLQHWMLDVGRWVLDVLPSLRRLSAFGE
jgi:hypothetical protein